MISHQFLHAKFFPPAVPNPPSADAVVAAPGIFICFNSIFFFKDLFPKSCSSCVSGRGEAEMASDKVGSKSSTVRISISERRAHLADGFS